MPSPGHTGLQTHTPSPLRLYWVGARGESPALQAQACAGLRAQVQRLDGTDWQRQGLAPFTPGPALVVIEVHEAGAALRPGGLSWAAATSQRPWVLVLLPVSARTAVGAWLDAGADRCLLLDSDPALIQAMLRAMAHRIQGQLATYTEHGGLRFDHDTHTLFHATGRVPLTCRETRVARLFFERGERPVKALDIWCALGKDGDLPSSSSLIALYVHRINRKIQPHGLHIDFRKAYGYRLQPWTDTSVPPLRVDWLGLQCP